jgi:hypothetical protein
VTLRYLEAEPDAPALPAGRQRPPAAGLRWVHTERVSRTLHRLAADARRVAVATKDNSPDSWFAGEPHTKNSNCGGLRQHRLP